MPIGRVAVSSYYRLNGGISFLTLFCTRRIGTLKDKVALRKISTWHSSKFERTDDAESRGGRHSADSPPTNSIPHRSMATSTISEATTMIDSGNDDSEDVAKPLARLIALRQELGSSRTLSSISDFLDVIKGLISVGLPEEAIPVLRLAVQQQVAIHENIYQDISRELKIKANWVSLIELEAVSRRHLGSAYAGLSSDRIEALVELGKHLKTQDLLQDGTADERLIPQVSFNKAFRAHLANYDIKKATTILNEMSNAGTPISQTSQVAVLHSFKKLNITEEGRQIILRGISTGQANVSVLNAALRLSIAHGDDALFANILRCFHPLRGPREISFMSDGPSLLTEPNVATYGIMISRYASQAALPQAMSCLLQASKKASRLPLVVTMGMITVYLNTGRYVDVAWIMRRICEGHREWNPAAMKPTLDQLCELLSSLQIRAVPEGGEALSARLFSGWKDVQLSGSHLACILQHVVRLKRFDAVLPVVQILRSLGLPFPPTLMHTILKHKNAIIGDRNLSADQLNIAAQLLPELAHGQAPSLETFNIVNARLLKRSKTHLFNGYRWSPNSPTAEPVTEGPPLSADARRSPEKHLMSDAHTFSIRLGLAGARGDLATARRYFDNLVATGFKANLHHYAALMEGYALKGNMMVAKQTMRLYEESNAGSGPRRFSGTRRFQVLGHVLLWTILVLGFSKIGRPDQARLSMDQMITEGIHPDVPMIQALARAHLQSGQLQSARTAILDYWPSQQLGHLNSEIRQKSLKELLGVLSMFSKNDHLTGRQPDARLFNRRGASRWGMGLDRLLSAVNTQAMPSKETLKQRRILRRRLKDSRILNRLRIVSKPGEGLPLTFGRSGMARYEAKAWSE